MQSAHFLQTGLTLGVCQIFVIYDDVFLSGERSSTKQTRYAAYSILKQTALTQLHGLNSLSN